MLVLTMYLKKLNLRGFPGESQKSVADFRGKLTESI